jgi:hypothetical protein
MGFRDDARRLAELKQANPDLSARELQQMLQFEKHEANSARFEVHFAPTAVQPYVEVVPYKSFKRDLNAFVKTYIGIVGVQPEDTFAIFTAPDQDGEGALSIVYRDRPEYHEGRRRYHQAVPGVGGERR